MDAINHRERCIKRTFLARRPGIVKKNGHCPARRVRTVGLPAVARDRFACVPILGRTRRPVLRCKNHHAGFAGELGRFGLLPVQTMQGAFDRKLKIRPALTYTGIVLIA